MPAPDAINAIVERYRFHRDAYLRGQEKYNEMQLRQDFIDPFFRALGWDVNNNKGFSEAYREVLHGEPVRVRGTTQFFDYTFRIGGLRKFIVETKKPSVRIKDDADAALQLRWYAWNAKLPLSILTNFEEFAIYDCTRKPSTSDAAAVARIEYFTYKDFLEKWEYIQSIFAQESILTGSFDKFAESTKGKHGTAGVDDAFLQEIEEWRETLARNFALRNPTLSVEELNAVVQRTIDRIIFLRICEDRGIEDYKTLFNLLEGDHVYECLCTIFRNADDKYNSGLFHFQQEPDWDELPDTLSLSLSLDDKVLKGIIKRLYYPDSPYLFSVIPPVILGNVYEQFLGKVIRLTEGHQAKVEYKPEVKKAHGVYYTPEYIVSYIVRHTVGELLKDKNPREVSKIRILDPACGSGSFLLGAYQYLLDWHRDWYIANLVPVFKEKNSVTDPAVQALLPEPAPKKKKAVAQIDLPIYKAGSNGDASRMRSDWRLTTAEKKRILLNNLFGVDIDQMAVEVTKLSLLLKVLEEENEENISKQLKLFAERALPSLHQNIKCGNSLIGWDILTPEMPTDDVKRINPFDWEREYAEVMMAGGFDAVIGNPPYVRMESIISENKKYFEKRYQSVSGRADLYIYFIEKGVKILKKMGLISYICSNKFIKEVYGKNLRHFLVDNVQILGLIDFGELPVFQGASTFPAIFLFRKSNLQKYSFNFCAIKNLNFSSLEQTVNETCISVSNEKLALDRWTFFDDSTTAVIEKILAKWKPLCEYSETKILYGIKTGLNRAFIVDEKTKNLLVAEDSHAQEVIKPLLVGNDIRKYRIDFDKKFLLYMHHGIEINRYPSIQKYLEPFKDALKGRATNQKWFELQQPQLAYKQFYDTKKIIWPDIAKESRFTFDDRGYYLETTCFFIPSNDFYLLGILNSSVCWYYLKEHSPVLGDKDKGGRLRLKKAYIEHFPIRTINPNDPLDKARHDRMVILVTQMLDLNKKLQDARLEQERTMLSRQIEATDASIDKLVYELYGLTDEEIAVVEGK